MEILDNKMPQMTLEKQIQMIITVCNLHNFICLYQNGTQISPWLPFTGGGHIDPLLDADAKNFMTQLRTRLANEIWESCSA